MTSHSLGSEKCVTGGIGHVMSDVSRDVKKFVNFVQKYLEWLTIIAKTFFSDTFFVYGLTLFIGPILCISSF